MNDNEYSELKKAIANPPHYADDDLILEWQNMVAEYEQQHNNGHDNTEPELVSNSDDADQEQQNPETDAWGIEHEPLTPEKWMLENCPDLPGQLQNGEITFEEARQLVSNAPRALYAPMLNYLRKLKPIALPQTDIEKIREGLDAGFPHLLTMIENNKLSFEDVFNIVYAHGLLKHTTHDNAHNYAMDVMRDIARFYPEFVKSGMQQTDDSEPQQPGDCEPEYKPLWLSNYVEFSKKWSPRAFDGFHEAIGLWLLSTIAGRRVKLNFGGERYPSLYFAMVAKTSIYAKSTTTDIAIDLLDRLGLTFLLAPDDSTPQKFIADLTKNLPQDYDKLDNDKQTLVKKRLAFAGQRGWFYEEFGQKLSAMMRENGVMADYRSLLRRFWDNKNSYEYATVSRGSNYVEKPYLALLANCTPADMRNAANRGNALWNDGFMARFVFLCPPASGKRSKARFPRGERFFPVELLNPILAWHSALGKPNVDIDKVKDQNGLWTGDYDVDVEEIEGQTCQFGQGVVDAFYEYADLLGDMIDDNEAESDLHGNLARLPEIALRVAMLIASLENNGLIELKHWQYAQYLAEKWRVNLYELYEQCNTPTDNEEAVIEEKIVNIIHKHFTDGGTANQIRRYIRGMSSSEVQAYCERLVSAGALAKENTKRTVLYLLNRTGDK